MKLILKNIGLLKQAEITLHPLCVIAGENDNGKSTVGKIIFCIIKAINRYKEDLKVSKGYEISEVLRQAFFDLRRTDDAKELETSISLQSLRRAFTDESRLLDLMPVFNDLIIDIFKDPEISEEIKEIAKKLEKEVKEIAAKPENSKKAIEQAFAKIFTAEFDSEVLLVGANEGMIQLWENNVCLIDLKILKNNEVVLLNDVEPIEIKDATFVETPLVLNFHDVLSRSQTLLEVNAYQRYSLSAYTTLHTKDLFDKLRQPNLAENSEKISNLLQTLGEIVKGSISFSRKSRDFIFTKDNKEISIKNTASGIKSFGTLQILLENGFINKNTLLVLDEPENHLHPKWQIKFAELLVMLAASGAFILVSAHSPYMIEALERFSEKYKIKKQSGFYLAENKKIENKNKLEEIFNLLAEPFEVFKDMDLEVMQDE